MIFFEKLLWERKCYSCFSPGAFLCRTCNNDITKYSPYCYVCKKENRDFQVHNTCKKHLNIDKILVLTRYRHMSIKRMLKTWKYYKKYKTYEDIVSVNSDFFKKYIQEKDALLIPIPMYFFRRWWRGYNHAEKISYALWKQLSVEVYANLLYRKKHVRQQSKLSVSQRWVNVRGVFWIKNRDIAKSTPIYLVDDVISSWNTLKEAADLLRSHWYTNISAVVIASD